MNKHDLICARIVAAATETKRLPASARSAVSAALHGHGITLQQLGAVQDARETPAPQAQTAQPAPSPTDEAAQIASQRMASQYDGIITALLKERMAAGEIDSCDPRDLDARGILKGFRYPDGVSEYELNGAALVKFWPPEVAFADDGAMLVHQRYLLA